MAHHQPTVRQWWRNDAGERRPLPHAVAQRSCAGERLVGRPESHLAQIYCYIACQSGLGYLFIVVFVNCTVYILLPSIHDELHWR